MPSFGTTSLVLRASLVALATAVTCAVPAAADTGAGASTAKLDTVLRARAQQLTGSSRVIVQFRGEPDVRAITGRGGRTGRSVGQSGARVAEISNVALAPLAEDPRVASVSVDGPTFSLMERTGAAVGAAVARQEFGLTGAGVGVAIIDSGISGAHDDFVSSSGNGGLAWSSRVVHFTDFTSGFAGGWSTYATDLYGHGTHVAGVIGGNGYDSGGLRTGIAPGANLVALKVLDGNGYGYTSDAIAALDYAIAIKDVYNIRVINLSIASGVYESFETDPFAQAAKRAVDAGIIVVAAAGNLGRHTSGAAQYGGITSPGNAPWVLTVGAASHQGTAARSNDTIGIFSSRGPSWIDFAAKPDLVAPGVGIESTTDPFSTLSQLNPTSQVAGNDPSLWYKPYLSLSGTSVAAPVVTGTVALMLQANPQLTPNAVKAILQYTAQVREGYDFLTQGAGLLNTRGAIRMASFFAHPSSSGPGAMEDVLAGERVAWSRHLLWGNYQVKGGILLPGSNAWALGQRWGGLSTPEGQPVVWGAQNLDNIVWATANNIVWATDDNIVWATDDDNIVWATARNIVWATANNIVWATDENIVWATVENIVWATDCGGVDCVGVTWGQRSASGAIWGTANEDDNIVWATAANIVWATVLENTTMWSASPATPVVAPPTATTSGTSRDRAPRRR
jgi:serine protease AprX